MPKFQGTDFYQIDDLLSDEERLTRQTVREFVDEEVLPVIRDNYRDGTFPTQLIAQIGKLGLLGSNLQGYGCAGAGRLYCIQVRQGIRLFIDTGVLQYEFAT